VSDGRPHGLTVGEEQISLVIASAGDSVSTVPATRPGRASSDESQFVEIAFVNNMPSSAFDATEQQFLGLLGAAAEEVGLVVRVHRYVIAGLERSPEVQERLEHDYSPIELIYCAPIDGLVVTGTEPLERDLKDEVYWDALARLVGWAENATASTVVSCLAAHAAALIFDGIERETLATKCSGVFVQQVCAGHVLTAGLGRSVYMPHSRLNDLPAALLQAGGYTSLIDSPEMNWTVATKDKGRCTFVLVQGHPEYSTTSLLREYRRDMQRYLREERPSVPAIPVGYLDDEGRALLEAFEARALRASGDKELMDEFPFEVVAARLVNTWRSTGTHLYANWLSLIESRRRPNA
jgi:homoserine O-succinyltransferase